MKNNITILNFFHQKLMVFDKVVMQIYKSALEIVLKSNEMKGCSKC